MSDILGPTEVDAYRKIPHADFGVFRYSGLIATIDALAEALRAEHIFRMAVVNDAADMDELLLAQRAANATLSRVAAWLEESNE